MSIDKKLEQYLTQLDQSLGQISVSEKAEIVSEIKSHILDTLEKNPKESLSSILQSFGEPEAIATRYLTERGLKPVAAPKRQVVKWLTIGLLGSFAMVLLFVIVLIWKFTPLIKIESSADKDTVELLGGMLKINEDQGTIKFNENDINFELNLGSDEGAWVSGEKPLDLDQIKTLQIEFANGGLDVKNHDDARLSWKCKIKGSEDGLIFDAAKADAYISFGSAKKIQCDILMPQSMALKIRGNNGKVAVIKPQRAVDIRLNNGKVEIQPDQKQNYHYEMKINNGKVDRFVSSGGSDAIGIKVNLNNGMIRHEK